MRRNLRNSQEYEEVAGGNTSKGNEGALPAMAGKLRNSQEYEEVPSALALVRGHNQKQLKKYQQRPSLMVMSTG